jgi:hypothetical protein
LEQAAAIANVGTGVDLTTFLADGWAWDNWINATLTQKGKKIHFYLPPYNVDTRQHMSVSVPASEYQITIRASLISMNDSYHGFMIGHKCAIGAASRLSCIILDARGALGIRWFDMLTQSSGGNEGYLLGPTALFAPMWIRLHDTDGSTPSFGTITWSLSNDGLTWITARSINKSSGYLSGEGYNLLVIGGYSLHATQETYGVLDYYKLETL